MIPHFIAGFVQETRMRYVMLLQSLTGILATALDAINPDSNSVRLVLTNQSFAASSFFLARAGQDMHKAVEAILTAAILDTGMRDSPKMTAEHIRELRDNADLVLEELNMRLRAITIGNTGVVVNELRRVKLTTSLLQSSGMSRFGALMKARMNRVGDLKFVTPDSVGRKWRSSDYIAAMLSKELQQLYVESFLYCAVLDGDQRASVVYSDSNHVNHGLVFAITGDEGPTFDTIKDTIWHPNSTAGVERVHS